MRTWMLAVGVVACTEPVGRLPTDSEHTSEMSDPGTDSNGDSGTGTASESSGESGVATASDSTTALDPYASVRAWLASDGADVVNLSVSAVYKGLGSADPPHCAALDASCLSVPCPGEMCFYRAEFMYESTPATPPLWGSEPSTEANLHIEAQLSVIVRDEGGTLPIMIYNHGGTSISAPDHEFIGRAIDRGFEVVASHYRGSGRSEGEVEGCRGEGEDVRVLTDRVRAIAPSIPRVMAGGSHGGCVSLQALLSGADVDVAALFFPGTDSARRYVYHTELADPTGPLAAAGGTCPQAQQEFNFISKMVSDADLGMGGPLDEPLSRDYHCDDPSFRPWSSAWEGYEEIGAWFCASSPLSRATSFDSVSADVLIIHGERDPFIDVTESCRFAEQAGGFSVLRVQEDGTVAPASANPCADFVALDHTEEAAVEAWPGRMLVLIEAMGHGDVPRPSLHNPCDDRTVVAPDVVEQLFTYLAAKLP